MSKLDGYDSATPNAAEVANDFISGSDQSSPTLYRQEQPWLKTYWRPAIAWSYLVTCVFDFIIFPIVWSLFQAYYKGSIEVPWTPITLHGAGLYHLAMGAAIGISAYSRGKEKLNDKF